MNEIQLLMESVSPMFLYGASNWDPELRAAPFRGQLRYWFRTLHPGLSRQDLAKAESALFGSTQLGSRVALAVAPQKKGSVKIGNRYYLPHKIDASTKNYLKRRFSSPAFLEKTNFILKLGFQSNDIGDEFFRAFLLWLNLGGVGKRARRGFGSLQVTAINKGDMPEAIEALLPTQLMPNGDVLSTHIHAILQTALPDQDVKSVSDTSIFPAAGNDENYPSFAPGAWAVLVCKHAFASYEDAMKQFWKDHLRTGDFVENQDAFGYAHGRRRRASPFHLHIGQSNMGYHLICSVFKSCPSPATAYWYWNQRLFSSCQRAYGGTLFVAEEGDENAA